MRSFFNLTAHNPTEAIMARTYQVNLLKAGVRKEVIVVANSQGEAKRKAMADNPGWQESGARDLGEAK
jgi:hypothetical protein